jgi:hypothetical protein
MLIFCGGIRTERDYFEGVKGAYHRLTISIIVRGSGVVPDQLVRAAAAYRDRRPDSYDEVWCIIDVDEFEVSAAVLEAGRRGVNLAISNPCFELWLLLHHAERTAYCSGYAEVVRLLKKHVRAYDKARIRFVDFADGLADAIGRARKLDATGENWQRNPSTSVWRLVEQIVEKT